jgi:predicted nucleic acid-binding protein
MVLIDTSAWVETLRERGNPDVRKRVHDHMYGGQACWMPMVRLELWNGARGDREKKALREFEQVLPELEVTAEVWDAAYDLARRARAAGLTIPVADLLIVACARHHGVAIETADAHFSELEKL